MLQVFADGKAIVPLVVPSSWVPRLNHLAVERRINRSALIRAAIAALYFEAGDAGDADREAAAKPQPSTQTRGEEEHHL